MMRGRRGVTLIEMLIVIVLVGMITAIGANRLRASPGMRARAAARQLAEDLDVGRTRALARKRAVRITFDIPNGRYGGYLDQDNDGTFTESAAEAVAFAPTSVWTLPERTMIGRGNAPRAPGDISDEVVTLPNGRAEFDTYGLTRPIGARGTIYLRDTQDPNAVAAVAVSGGAALRVLEWRNGAWQ